MILPMRLLAVDIGNTDIKFGLFVDDDLKVFWRVRGNYTHSEAFSAVFRESLAQKGVQFDALVYSTVVPAAAAGIRETLKFCYPGKIPMMAIHPMHSKMPVRLGDYPAERIGADRLVNLSGAHLMYPGRHLVVVDFGTATTFDAIRSDGLFLGGAIAPGLETFAGILSQRTALLPAVEVAADVRAIGTDTEKCLLSGIVLGYRGLVKEILAGIRREMQAAEPLIIATGGLAERFILTSADEVIFSVYEPTLTLRGLQALYAHNAVSTGAGETLQAAANDDAASVLPVSQAEDSRQAATTSGVQP